MTYGHTDIRTYVHRDGISEGNDVPKTTDGREHRPQQIYTIGHDSIRQGRADVFALQGKELYYDKHAASPMIDDAASPMIDDAASPMMTPSIMLQHALPMDGRQNRPRLLIGRYIAIL